MKSQLNKKLQYTYIYFFSFDILLHIDLSNVKSLSPGTNILEVLDKNIKKIPN